MIKEGLPPGIGSEAAPKDLFTKARESVEALMEERFGNQYLLEQW